MSSSHSSIPHSTNSKENSRGRGGKHNKERKNLFNSGMSREEVEELLEMMGQEKKYGPMKKKEKEKEGKQSKKVHDGGGSEGEHHHDNNLPLIDPLTGLTNAGHPTSPFRASTKPIAKDHYKRYHLSSSNGEYDTVGIITTTNSDWNGVRDWIVYHRHIGVTYFYLFCEHNPEEWREFERAAEIDIMAKGTFFDIKIKLINKGSIIASLGHLTPLNSLDYCENPSVCSTVLREGWLNNWFLGECNSELFVRQSFNMEDGITFALSDGVDWIAHVDTDELIYTTTGGKDLNIRRAVSGVERIYDSIIMNNWEGVPESSRGEGKVFEDVTLFKKNYKDTTPPHQALKFLTYANGKSLARVKPGLRSHGAHRFKSRLTWTFTEAPPSHGIIVLHYTYCRLSTARGRGEAGVACGCEPTVEGAEKCFILDFDRKTFVKSVKVNNGTITEQQFEEWYEREVFMGDAHKVEQGVRKGVLARLELPGVIVAGGM